MCVDGEILSLVDCIPDVPIMEMSIDKDNKRLIAVDDDEQFYTTDLSGIINSLP